jgi:hypothetical protein
MRPISLAGLLPVCATLAGLTAAGAWSIRVGWADYEARKQTVAGTARAITLVPDNAAYSAQLAPLVSDDDPRKARSAIERALSLNPWDARSWIDLGLRAENDGDGTMAERCLSRAAAVDKGFQPRWTLANYYFRHDDRAQFWVWAKDAAEMVSGDPQPLFRLCGRLEEKGDLIDRLAIRNPDLRAAYLYYLLSQNRVDLVGPAVHRLLEDNREAYVPLLVTVCDRYLDGARVDEAEDLWRRLGQARRLPFEALATGQLLTNANFTTPPASRGFDWRLSGAEGISANREDAQGLRITFSGSEPEQCEVLAQLVPVRSQSRYELRFRYRTEGIARGAGLAWRVISAVDGAVLAEGQSLESESDSDRQILFETPAECRLVRLSLQYHRAPGTTRIEGFLVLQEVALSLAAQAPGAGGRVRK